MSSAPHTSPRISRKYLRNRRPRWRCRRSRFWAIKASTGFKRRCSLNHLVGAQQHGLRYRQAQLFCYAGIDDQTELPRLLDRHQRGLLPLQDARYIVPGAPEDVLEIRTVDGEAISGQLRDIVNEGQA